MLQFLGWSLMGASIVLMAAQNFVIKHVTSRPLGSLAPGYAATYWGYYNYASMVGVIGIAAVAVSLGSAPLLLLAVVLFILGTVTIAFGEVRTYRALKR